jgi:hypothetical protein
MNHVLLVPMHLDALWLTTDLSVVEAKVDFSRLPYWDGTREVNPDVANISEELLARPFEDRGLQLRAGVHLHWALPDALTRGAIAENNTTFPAVPNRWLVTRSRQEQGKERLERQWIVESDYLYPADAGAVSGSITIPFPAEKDHPPFRYLGRKMPFSAWTEATAEAATGKYLGALGYQLTAVGYQHKATYLLPGLPVYADSRLWSMATESGRGYAEPTFAAFYPNCQSVFGFHDAAPPATLRDVQYDVMGWYSDPTQDCLRAIETLIQERAKITKQAALQEVYQWDVTEGAMPDTTVCYARLTVKKDTPPSCVRPDKAVTIAVGNTSTQALSAYMAQTLAPALHITPSRLEEQLEALHLAARLGARTLDVGAKFAEARHERGFTAVPAGTLWGINQVSANTDRTDAAEDSPQETLPDELAHLLNSLNLLQMAYDQAGHVLESMQKQLFADWYKYMLSAYPPDDTRDNYPDIDEVRYFIEKNDLLPITRQQGKRQVLQSQCRRLHARVTTKVKEYRERTKRPYALQPRPAPRYWQPHEPVLLIADAEIAPTTRHGQDGRLHPEGLLTCHVQSVNEADFKKQLAALRDIIGTLQPKLGEAAIGWHPWTEQPWHPFILEWRVEISPLHARNNLDKTTRDYAPEFITSNYQLGEDAVDLVLKPGQVAIAKAASTFTGSSILTPHAKLQLQERIKAFLAKRLLKKYFDTQHIPEQDRTDDYFEKHVAEIKTWYNTKKTDQTIADPVVDTMLQVAEVIDKPDFHVLAQSLNGFNEALLMCRQTLQLPIADPLGFEEAQAFTRAVHTAVGQSNLSAPQPHNDFHPIRTGVLKMHKLRVVDTFGRVQNLTLQDDRVMATELMTTPANPPLVFLPPRLAQPARLNFRWLAAERGASAASDEPEMNAHPATTPVCGWLLPNHLDNSLMVYDNTGQALGSISARERQWIPAPGTSILPNEQWNVHLRTLVTHLLHVPDPAGQAPTFLEDFVSGIEIALARIDPANFAQHEALALLMGRPMAVVRAIVNLELRGQPAIVQDWNVFRTDIERDLRAELTQPDRRLNQPAQRDTDAVGKVRFPIRLGDGRQLNDGLVGYWKEQWSADDETYVYQEGRFYVHACDRAEVCTMDLSTLARDDAQKQQIAAVLGGVGTIVTKHDFLRLAEGDALWTWLCAQGVLRQVERNPYIHYAADTPDLAQALDDPPQKLTMLVDPRGVVHATCGILPTKALGIPPDQYARALQTLAITFLAAPILTGVGDKVCLPLPTEPGYTWSWLEKQHGAWSERAPIGPVSLEATFAEAQAIREGWLKLTKTQE